MKLMENVDRVLTSPVRLCVTLFSQSAIISQLCLIYCKVHEINCFVDKIGKLEPLGKIMLCHNVNVTTLCEKQKLPTLISVLCLHIKNCYPALF